MFLHQQTGLLADTRGGWSQNLRAELPKEDSHS